MILPNLTIAPSKKGGRGVFALKNIQAGTVLEISPVIALSTKDRIALEGTLLYNYIFEWGNTKKMGALGLGYVSMYNHDYTSNCEYEMDYKAATITIRTVRAVKKGEELCINYNADPNNPTKVWFDK
jgi:SET domain-containing protein